uniref:Iron-binding zinc finger CDGSH type domain-containing protein n=1 Tax=Clastoptera arizonana TaxID=38151 RepID=A0A1B6DF53_9HEMI
MLRNSIFNKFQSLLKSGQSRKDINATYWRQKSTEENPEIPKNTVADFNNAAHQAKKGVIYDKKPFKLKCVPNKKYHWCSCGQSKSQPLCDGTHRSPYLKIELKPVRFEVAEEKEYYLCNCKQTSNRPFCDGSHLQEEIQAKK